MISFAEKGDSIGNAVEKFISVLYREGSNDGTLIFNEVYLQVDINSLPQDIVTIYFLKHKINQLESTNS